MSQLLSPRLAQAGLIFLLIFYLSWDLRAVLTDQRLGPTDTTVEEAQGLLDMVHDEGLGALVGWSLRARKGPVAGILVALLTPLVGETLLAARILGLILHVLLLSALFRMAAKVTGQTWPGLLAVLICGTFPGEYGWFRMEYHDSLLVLVTLLAVWQLAGDLQSRRRAVLLGLTLALGMLSKVPFPVFIVGPGLLFAWRNLRSRRALANAALAAAAFCLAAGWYLIPNLLSIAEYVDGSHEPQFFHLGESLRSYFVIIPRTIPYLLAALVAAPLAWRLGRTRGALVASLTCSIFTGTIILLYFDPWSRYLTPAFPMAGLLVTLGLTPLIQRLARREVAWAYGVLAVMAMSLLGLYVRDNLVGITHPEGNREWGAGLIAPDRRPYQAYPRMVRYVKGRNIWVYSLGWTSKIEGCPNILQRLWIQRGQELPHLKPEQVEQKLHSGEPIHLVLCHRELAPLHGLSRAEAQEPMDAKVLAAARAQPIQVLASFSDPDGVRLTLLRMWKR